MLNDSDDLSRRSFVKLLGASLALAGLDGCTRMPAEKILPYVNQPPELTPGVPVYYATSMVLDGFATGLLVEAHDGRPTKIEGNPDHPASLGAAGVLEQASLLQLYDPNRARRVRSGRSASNWEVFAKAFAPAQLRSRVGQGERLALLLEPTSSPLLADLIARVQTLYPRVSVHYYAPLARSEAFIPQYDLRAADVILAVDSDFLAEGPFHLRYAREFADRRREPRAGMNRLYAMEGRFTVTGAAADHRYRATPSSIEGALQSLLGIIERSGSSTASPTVGATWLEAVAADLGAHRGRSVVIGGERMTRRASQLVTAINAALGNVGRTTWSTRSPLLGAGESTATIGPLVDAMRGGAVDTLICIGGNPSYATPRELDFVNLWRRVPNSAYIGLYENETARDAKWFVPEAHYLENWGDARAYDGTLSLVQPLVQPLNGGKSGADVLAMLAGSDRTKPLDLLRERWRQMGIAPNEESWAGSLRRGFVPDSALPRAEAPSALVAPAVGNMQGANVRGGGDGTVEVVFAPDSRVYDGSFANNAWLQELPDPITKLTWDNAALLAPATAQRFGVQTGDEVILEREGKSLGASALIVPGHAEGQVTLPFGYGRSGGEEVAREVGVNVYDFWPATNVFATTASIRRATSAGRRRFAITQTHWTMEGRDPARVETRSSLLAGPPPAPPRRRELTIYDPVQRLGAPMQWAMTIDLGSCIGCGACVVACQAENNIPVVGREEVLNAREMHWIRIDRYEHGTADDPAIVTQPMLCQHCENAPCEYVCPVGATTHSDEGLNEMVYNRCVGTRFCSNNCPYKVRRFNWFDYNAELSATERLAKNPDVTVRERGVMEKCTFCVQRIREAEIAAGREHRPVHSEDVKTACQQACPTSAIVFGSLTEQQSDVVRRREDGRAYAVLDELGTIPRVQYLARIRNANPVLSPERSA
ncbi:MAG TPA: 4Fe-4S dicluster domain-containing protein [Gemmatimonadaceae bacterium]|nr:4Fe-4S dicluster domain-containing protein [Gemmatimonadaceae bacterium]